MKIEKLFKRDIFRPINGVVKADQLDDSSVWQELDEFVVTRELDRHVRTFFSTYSEAIRNPTNTDIAGNIGIWISGFFGSGKSHLIKVLSYLLRNESHQHNGNSKHAVEFFQSKIKDAMLFGDIQRAVAAQTDVILFNIDSKADHRAGRDAILAVFLKVLNEMLGFCGDHPHIAHLERYLEGKGKLRQFHAAFQQATGSPWERERDAYHFHRDELAAALTATLGMSRESAEKWIDGAESSYALTIENFCKWVKEYLDSQGPARRIIFLVDEVGQFIGLDSQLMLNLQTLTEELGTICQGRAWIVVTAQEDIDSVLGEMKKTKKSDFSKIQGRFKTRLSLSSANVDEVIQSRLLEKASPEIEADLSDLFGQKGDILKHQLTFKDCGMNLPNFKDAADFAKNYPFAPYQFLLVQKIFEAIRGAGATGLHLSRGERSILDAFQAAGKQAAGKDVGVLVPLYGFYPSIESFLDTAVKKTIDQAKDDPLLEPFDICLLQVLFLIRYVKPIKGNVDNLVTLCIDEIDADRLALRRQIEASLNRLEVQSLISRHGDLYFFLTNEERDINKEIKEVELADGEDSRLLGELIFKDVLKDQSKHRYAANGTINKFNRLCDTYPIGSKTDGALLVSLVSPLDDEYELYKHPKCLLESGLDGGQVLVKLGNHEHLDKELRTYLKTQKYTIQKNDGSLLDSVKLILSNLANENQERRASLTKLVGDLFVEADFYVAGQPLALKATTPMAALEETLEYLVQNTFTKMGYLQTLSPEPLPEVQAILRSNDVGQQTLALDLEAGNKQALADVRSYVGLMAGANKQIVLHDMIEKRYALRPYGWPDEELLILLARLLVVGEISLMLDGELVPLDKAYSALATPAKRRKVTIIKRQTADPKAVQNARALGKELFHEMGPDGEDPLFDFLQARFRAWQSALIAYKPLAETGNYPGHDQITGALGVVKKLLAAGSSFKFIEQCNQLKADLLDLAEEFTDLEQFYEHQKPAWERLRKACDRFLLNRRELDRDASAGPALRRMQEILAAPSPYSLIKEAAGLIATVEAVNSGLIAPARQQAKERIADHFAALKNDLDAAGADARLRAACLTPLEALQGRVQTDESLAHISQAEHEALVELDAASARLDEVVRQRAQTMAGMGNAPPPPAIKKKRVVEPAKLVKTTYLETQADVDGFLDALRLALEQAVANGERVEIR